MKKAFKILVVIASVYFVFMAISVHTIKLPKYLIVNSVFAIYDIITYNISVISIVVLQFIFAVFCLIKFFWKNKTVLKIVSIILFIGVFVSGISTVASFVLDNQMTVVNNLLHNFAFLIGISFVGVSCFTSISAKLRMIVSIIAPSITILILILGLVNVTFNFSTLLAVILMVLYSLSLFVMLYFALSKDENKNETV